jgi:hypothetical protein
MDTLILVIQVTCVAGLACGTALSIFQLVKPGREVEGFSFARANDFETGFRRLARSRR